MEATLSDWILILISGCLALVALLSVISRGLRLWQTRETVSRRVICRLCLHAFEVRHHPEVVDCPCCGARNPTGRHQGAL